MLLARTLRHRRLLLTADKRNHGVGDSLKEEETIQHVDFDQHHGAGGDHVEKDDDIDDADGIQNHVPWTSQGLSELHHHGSWQSLNPQICRKKMS